MTTPNTGLGEVHALILELLAELDRVAAATGTSYFLAYGTAIGAVRDGTLIPWDVDADVWLPSQQYDDFLDRAAAQLGERFELIAPETHPDYEYLFPRLTIRGIHHVFVRVDLFPLDPAPRARWVQRGYLTLAHGLAQLYFVKKADTSVRHHYSAGKRWLTRALRLVSAPLPAGVVRRVFRALQAWSPGAGEPTVLVNSCGSYGLREIFDARWFDAAERLPVTGLSLPVPAGYDPLLTHVYGDYRTPVSEDRQHQELAFAQEMFVEPLRRSGLLPRGEEA